MKILVAGSSGLIGSALIAHLEGEGHETFRLVRPESAGSGLPRNPAEGPLAPAVLEDVDAVVTLAGRSIGAHRWTPVEKQLLWDSRVAPTRLLAERLAVAPSRPRVLVNASAVGYYGDRG